MPEFPQHIHVEQGLNNTFRLTVDGVEFPWYVSASGINVNVADEFPGITIKIPAGRVTVDHDWRTDPPTT